MALFYKYLNFVVSLLCLFLMLGQLFDFVWLLCDDELYLSLVQIYLRSSNTVIQTEVVH